MRKFIAGIVAGVVGTLAVLQVLIRKELDEMLKGL